MRIYCCGGLLTECTQFFALETSMSDYEGVSSIISAIATVLLAVVAQMFSMERGREAKRGEMRSQLIDANAQIDVEFAFLFFRSRGYMAPDGVQYMHGGDFESALDKNHTHPSTKTAVARVQLIRFLEALRGASLVFDEVVNNDFKGNPPRAVWRGKYDSATSNLRLGFEIFEKFYNHSVMVSFECPLIIKSLTLFIIFREEWKSTKSFFTTQLQAHKIGELCKRLPRHLFKIRNFIGMQRIIIHR